MKRVIIAMAVLLLCFIPLTFADDSGQPVGPEGQTPDSTYYATNEAGEQVQVDSELGKAALVLGGYVPIPNPDPKKAGTFLFVDPEAVTGVVAGGVPAPGAGTGVGAGPGAGAAPGPGVGAPGVQPGQPGAPAQPPAEPPAQPPAGEQGTITNNGSQPVTVQVKKGENDYEVRPLQPGESMNYPEGSHYIRVIPGVENPENPNVQVTSPGGKTKNLNDFWKKDSPPRDADQTSGLLAPPFVDDTAVVAGAGPPIGPEVHRGIPGEAEVYDAPDRD